MINKVYLAGPMAGWPDHNFPAFKHACIDLRSLGYEVLSPHEVDHGETNEDRGTTKPHAEYMRPDIRLLLECAGIVLMPGWHTSKGAMMELNLAVGLGLPVRTLFEINHGVHFS